MICEQLNGVGNSHNNDKMKERKKKLSRYMTTGFPMKSKNFQIKYVFYLAD